MKQAEEKVAAAEKVSSQPRNSKKMSEKKSKPQKSLLEMDEFDEFDLINDQELDDLFNDELAGIEDLFMDDFEEIDDDYLELEDLADAELIGFDDETLEALLAEELLNVMLV